MKFLSKLFGKGKELPTEALVGADSKVISQSDLALDANIAQSLIIGGGVGAAKIALSADDNRVFFATKQSLSQSDIKGLQNAIEQGLVELRHGLFNMPTYPVFVIRPTILDNPRNPFWLEVFPNIGGSDKAILQRLRRSRKLGICFHFYDQNGALLFRSGYEGTFFAKKLGQELVEAELYLDSLPSSSRDYRAAVHSRKPLTID